MRLKTLLRCLLVTMLMAVSATGVTGTRWGANYFPNVPLVTHEGEKVRFFDDVIKDKVVAINFIFTSCQASCPLETARMSNVQQILGDRVGKDVFMYSITIDPERDTPEVLNAYAKRFNAKPGWTFLTGKKEDIILIRKRLGVYLANVQNDNNNHNLSLVIGNQSIGRWKKKSPFENPYILADEIGNWLHNWKTPSSNNKDYASAPDLRKISKGESLFRTRCSACHSIDLAEGLAAKELVGPDLFGVTERRDRQWLVDWLRAPDKMLAKKDPIAIELFKQYNEVAMPNARLNQGEIDDLLKYMDEETSRIKLSKNAERLLKQSATDLPPAKQY